MSAGDWKELFQAACEGNMKLVVYHIKNGVNPNYQHPEILATPLVASIKENHTKVALYLIDKGASLDLESDFDAMTPIEAILKYDNKVLKKKLEELKIFPRFKLKIKYTLLNLNKKFGSAKETHFFKKKY